MPSILDPILMAQAAPATGELLPPDPAALEAFMKQMGAKPAKPAAPAAPVAPAAPAPDPLKLKQRLQERMKGTSLFGPIYAAANGGVFGTGDTVLVGEQGPELVQFNQPGAVIPNAGSSGGVADFLRMLLTGEFTSNPTGAGAVGASPLDRRGPQFGVAPATTGGAQVPSAGATAAATGISSASGAKPKTREQQELELIDLMQKQQDMYRSLVPSGRRS